MGLEPLEFSDCLTDSPVFRSKLHEHEKELERTSKAIKNLINDGKELLNASKRKLLVFYLFPLIVLVFAIYIDYSPIYGTKSVP